MSYRNIAARADDCRASIGCTSAWADRRATAGNDGATPPDRGTAAAGNGTNFDAISERLVTSLDADRSRSCDIQRGHRR